MASINFTEFHNIMANEKRSAAETCHGIDPRTGKELWPAPKASEHDVDDAVASARAALAGWSAAGYAERARQLSTVADELGSHADELAKLLATESGKALGMAKGEVERSIAGLRAHTTWTVPDETTIDNDEVKVVVEHAPIGVVAGILPWNFPVSILMIKAAPAMMVGCPIIVKPSPYTPYSALKIVEIMSRLLPVGVIQALSGDEALGPKIVSHPGIDKISFTGSIPTGKKVAAAAAGTLKRLNLELGGNDAAIVTEDVDVAKVAAMVAGSAFVHSAQVCIATKRIYVHEAILDDFMQHLKAIVGAYQPGEGLISPIQNKMQYEKVQSMFRDCRDNKYEFAVGDCDTAWDDAQPGYFVRPAVILNPPDNSRIVREEPFGPIVPVLTWSDDAQVIARANDTLTGLGGTVYCRDEKRARRLASGMETGNVWINSGVKMEPTTLVGAQKQSGIGTMMGPLGMKGFTSTRTVTYWK